MRIVSGMWRGRPLKAPAGTTTNPRGLRSFEAICATSLFVAMPNDTVICNSSQIVRCSFRTPASTSASVANPHPLTSR